LTTVEAFQVDAIAEDCDPSFRHPQPPEYGQILFVLQELCIRAGGGNAFEAVDNRAWRASLPEAAEPVDGVHDDRDAQGAATRP
jgi:hypothetical protein